MSSVDRPADFPMDDACWAAQILCSFFGSGTPIPPATGTPAFLLSSRVFVVALPPNVKPAQQPAPALHESNRLRFTGCMKRINVVPGLQRRSPLQVLMWPDFVVPTSEVAQKQVYGFPVSQHDLPELVLQRPEQPFNPPVLPRAVQVDPLVFDAQQCQARAERAAGEAPLVVGAHESGFAVFRYRQTQVSQQRPATFIHHRVERQQASTAVIDDAQNLVNRATGISTPGHVQRPAMIDRAVPGFGTAHRLPRLPHRMRLLTQRPMHVALAHRYLVVRENPVERQRNRSAPGIRQVCLEQHQLTVHPFRLALEG